ncbi:MAG: acyl-CoA thioesterase, partial [Bacteroidota bacterium]|nr:acyl-CoA thioesterase [Bacteroidota bacterium]
MQINYPVSLELRIDWSELDMHGHVNNVAYHKYIQASRIHYWEQVGITNLYSENKTGPMLASTALQFRKPLFYPGNIVVKARIELIKTTSFILHHIILNNEGEICAEAQDVIVMFDFISNQKAPFSDQLRAVVEKLEGR